MDRSINAPNQAKNKITEWVWYDGTDTILAGTGVCYHWDYEAPVSPANLSGDATTTADARRTNRVVKPSANYAKWFAGVCISDHLVAYPGGQLIEIACPGSTCTALVAGLSLVIGEGVYTFQVGAAVPTYAAGDGPGILTTHAGAEGIGTAVPLQTVDATVASGAVKKVLVRLLTGTQTGMAEVLAPPGTAGGALQSMADGTTAYAAATNTSATLTTTLANGTYIGQRKVFTINGTQTTHGVVVTVTSGVQIDGTTALNSMTSSTANSTAVLVWDGAHWKLMSNSGWSLT